MAMSNQQDECYESFRVDVEQSHRMSEVTIAYYDRMAEAYWDGTRDHDVSQNYTAFLDAIENDPPYSILDLGCGPGRDLHHFRLLGHNAVGLDGSTEFVAMARSYSGCQVLHQDFLTMKLPESRFDGVFSNASLFHVPSRELPRVLLELSETLRPRGVLFCSNPRGNNDAFAKMPCSTNFRFASRVNEGAPESTARACPLPKTFVKICRLLGHRFACLRPAASTTVRSNKRLRCCGEKRAAIYHCG